MDCVWDLLKSFRNALTRSRTWVRTPYYQDGILSMNTPGGMMSLLKYPPRLCSMISATCIRVAVVTYPVTSSLLPLFRATAYCITSKSSGSVSQYTINASIRRRRNAAPRPRLRNIGERVSGVNGTRVISLRQIVYLEVRIYGP